MKIQMIVTRIEMCEGTYAHVADMVTAESLVGVDGTIEFSTPPGNLHVGDTIEVTVEMDAR